MGKNLNTASQKISKSERRQQQHQQSFNNLIKVLKPKVYITDSSSFKQLVQELTGNGSGRDSTTTSSPTIKEHKMNETYPLIESDLVQRVNSDDDTSFASAVNEEFDQVWNQLCLEDNVVLQDSMTSQSLDPLWTYQNLESLLFDVEPSPLLNCYAQIDQGVSIYDYELCGLI